MKKLSLFLLIAAAATLASCSNTDSLTSSNTPSTSGSGSSFHLVSKGTYKGHSWSDWSNAWWEWAYSMPLGANAVEGTAPMETNQNGDVWFLAGSFAGGTESRTITITKGKALFIPILNFYADTTGGAPAPNELISVLQGAWDGAHPVSESATIDGQTITNVSTDYFAEPILFTNQNILLHNAIGDKKGVRSLATSCGDYLMIDDLTVGTHTVQFTASNSYGYSVDMTYTITVK
jgi:hypothetical protein